MARAVRRRPPDRRGHADPAVPVVGAVPPRRPASAADPAARPHPGNCTPGGLAGVPPGPGLAAGRRPGRPTAIHPHRGPAGRIRRSPFLITPAAPTSTPATRSGRTVGGPHETAHVSKRVTLTSYVQQLSSN